MHIYERLKMTSSLQSRETIKVVTDTGMLYIASMKSSGSNGDDEEAFLYCVLEDKLGNVLNRFEISASEAERLIPVLAALK